MEHLPKIYLYRRVVQAKLFIDAKFAEEIDLNNISDEACFSKFHFLRLFKGIYGKTPHQYLIHVRIENAKLLLTKNYSVTETCFLVGFDSVTSFSGLFKKLNAITPSAYQQMQQKRKAEITAKPLSFIPNCFAENNVWVE